MSRAASVILRTLATAATFPLTPTTSGKSTVPTRADQAWRAPSSFGSCCSSAGFGFSAPNQLVGNSEQAERDRRAAAARKRRMGAMARLITWRPPPACP